MFWFFGHNSDTLARIWTKLGGNFSHESPEASCTVQGLNQQPATEKNEKNLPTKKSNKLEKHVFLLFSAQETSPDLGTWYIYKFVT